MKFPVHSFAEFVEVAHGDVGIAVFQQLESCVVVQDLA